MQIAKNDWTAMDLARRIAMAIFLPMEKCND